MHDAEHQSAFGEYLVEQYLASGQFGLVFRVSKVEDGTKAEFAVKWLKADASSRGRIRFKNELWALTQLNHPAIPKIIGSGIQGGAERPYIVMTLAPGRSLQKIYDEDYKNHGPMSPGKVLRIVKVLLDALAHAHARGIYHRDVKPDNVVVTDSIGDVTLVDFGVCKGNEQPEDAKTFAYVGASRFSPPSKLRYANETHETHDVFAVGVLAYLLLTNSFPWSVAENVSAGRLADLMEDAGPVRISDSYVSKEISDYFLYLMDIRDARMPGATIVLDRLEGLLTKQPGLAPYGPKPIPYPRVIRDPVHGDIVMTEFERTLIDTPEFQRLRWRKQLGTSHLVYPGAEHTRFSHAIGTMHVASKILTRIEQRTRERFDAEEHLMARTYALVHDVSQIPFGHTLEDELQIFPRHDHNEKRIRQLVMRDDSRLGKLLHSTSFGKAVLAMLDVNSVAKATTWVAELVEASYGADVIDYVDRDAFYCGLDHRIDSAIYRNFAVSTRADDISQREYLVAHLFGRHGVRLDARYALESILRERYALFMKVYNHPVKVAAGAMIGKAVLQAMTNPEHANFADAIVNMSDDGLLQFLKGESDFCVEMAKRIVERRLYRPAFRGRILPDHKAKVANYEARRSDFEKMGLLSPQGRAKTEKEIAKHAGLENSEQVIFYCAGKAPGLKKLIQRIKNAPGPIEIQDEAHEVNRSIYRAHINLWTMYVFIPPEKGQGIADHVANIVQSMFGIKNEVTEKQRQLVWPF